MKLLLVAAVAVALAAGPAAAQLKMPKGYQPPSYAPLPKPAEAAKPKPPTASQPAPAPAFKPYESWKPAKPASVYGPDGKKKR